MKKFILSAVVLFSAAAINTSSAQGRVKNNSNAEWRRPGNKVVVNHPRDNEYDKAPKIKNPKYRGHNRNVYVRKNKAAKIKSNNGRGHAYGHYKGKAKGKAKGHY